MASNKELAEQISVLSEKLGIEVPSLKELKNDGLQKLVAELEEAVAAMVPPPVNGDDQTGEGDGNQPPPVNGQTGERIAADAPVSFAHQVAPNVSIYGNRGFRGPGEEVLLGKDAPTAVDMNHWIELGVVLGAKVSTIELEPAAPES
jgi:hypothetical protein